MAYTNDEATVIRKWIVEQVSLIIDNDERALGEVTEAACRAVLEFEGSDWYEYSYHHQGGPGKDRYADAVGSAVTDVISEWIPADDALLTLMLREVLDLNDSAQAYLFGLHYLPEPADMKEWARDNEEFAWLDEKDQ